MRKQKKTDNKQIDMKLELREQVLRRAGIKACRVLDLFAGRGEIWTARACHKISPGCAHCYMFTAQLNQSEARQGPCVLGPQRRATDKDLE